MLMSLVLLLVSSVSIYANPAIITISQRDENSIVVYDMEKNGHLVERVGSPFPTGGRGEPSSSNQDSLIRVENFVIGINGGDNSIFVMKEDESGSFQTVFQQASISSLKLSTLAYSHGRVYAGHSAPFVRGRSKKEVITVYKWDGDGRLTPEVSNSIFFEDSPGIQVADIRLNDSGETLAISYTLRPQVLDLIFKFRGISYINFYSVDRDSGKMTHSKNFSHSSPKGEGFGVVWNGDSVLYQMITRSRVDVYSVEGGSIKSVDTFPAGGLACCWGVISDKGEGQKFLYTSNYAGSEKLSSFVIGRDPLSLERQEGVELSGVSTFDLAISGDDNFLFVLVSNRSVWSDILKILSFGLIPEVTKGGVLTFKIRDDGTLESVSELKGIPTTGFLFFDSVSR